jgi:predicted amidohydrolase YtcJ
VIDPADVPRLRTLGVVASLQPIVGLGVPGAPLEPCLSRIGPKMPYAYAWQTLRAAGAAIAFSSDWPVSPLDPFLGMQAAMTRRPALPGLPEQRQSLMDTLAAFTSDGAYAEFAEDKKGRLAPGLLADVIVLNADVETIPAAEFSTIKPVVTICDGRITYEA